MSAQQSRQKLAIWLFAVCGLIALMVVVGGLTRLTDSGLSITTWKPIHGALPPLSLAEWNEEFEAYKQIPQYLKLNKGMTLDEFKSIFWWEWSHRNLGRLIGLAFLLPFVFFLFKRQVERPLIPRLVFLFILGGMQGVLGWYMVASGLTERVDVNQYRLVAHLGLALVIYGAILITALPLWRGQWPVLREPHPLYRWSHITAALIFLQILLGGFVAGTDAGLVYNTWPLMDEVMIPPGVWAFDPVWLAPFEDVTTIQFNHRIMGYVVFLAVVSLVVAALKQGVSGWRQTTSLFLLGAVVLQVGLGIWTLIAVMPIWLAVLHQFGALILLTAALLHVDAFRTRT